MELIDICCLSSTGDYHKKSNLKYKERTSFLHFRGLFMPMRKSPLFCLKRRQKKKWRKLNAKRILPLC